MPETATAFTSQTVESANVVFAPGAPKPSPAVFSKAQSIVRQRDAVVRVRGRHWLVQSASDPGIYYKVQIVTNHNLAYFGTNVRSKPYRVEGVCACPATAFCAHLLAAAVHERALNSGLRRAH